MHEPTRSRRTTCALVVGVLAFVLAAAAATMPATGATGGTVVGASVPSAVTLDDTGCRTSGALDLGNATPSSWLIGSACSVSFGSSNDTARLKLFQRDETGTAMESISTAWTPRSGAASWNAVETGSVAGLAWVGGSGGPGEPASRLEKTTDGGATWTTQTTCNGGATVDIERITDSELFLLTNGAICRTTDGGANWSTVFSGASMLRLDMVSATVGYAVGNGNRVYRTTNGTTWTEVHANGTIAILSAVSASPGGTVVVSGRTSAMPNSTFGVIVSLDGGATWTTTVLDTSPGVDSYGVYGAYAVTDSTLIISMPRTGTWRSTDSGATWTQVLMVTWSGEPFRRSDGTLMVAYGDSVRTTTDAGATWGTINVTPGSGNHTRQVSGVGLGELWIVGYGDNRTHSTDGGATWATMSPVKANWRAVAAWNSQRWAIAGNGGVGVRTSDAGVTLSSMVTGTTAQLNDAVSLPGGSGVLVGTNVILRTTDYGASWQPATPPFAGINWTEVERDDEGNLWVAGSSGRVGSSSDGGLTWTLHTTVTGSPHISALNVWRGQIWVGASAGQVWRSSTAAALSWSAVPTGQSMPVSSIWAIDATTAVALTDYEAATDSSHVSRTTDGGATWTAGVPSSIKHTRTIAVDDGHRFGWVTGSANVARSDDRGLTWGPASSVGVGQYIQRMQPLNGGRLVAVGDSSLVAVSAPTKTVPDGMAGASGFGACLETATGTSATDWVVAGAGNCTSAITGNWSAIAADATGPTARVATTATGGTGVLALRFGLKVGSSIDSGSYAAGVVFEAAAPAV